MQLHGYSLIKVGGLIIILKKNLFALKLTLKKKIFLQKGLIISFMQLKIFSLFTKNIKTNL